MTFVFHVRWRPAGDNLRGNVTVSDTLCTTYAHCFVPLVFEGCGKSEAYNKRSTVRPETAAPVTGTALRTTGPAPAASQQ